MTDFQRSARHYSSENGNTDTNNESAALTNKRQVFLTYRPLVENEDRLKLRKLTYLKPLVISHAKVAKSLVDRLGTQKIVLILKSLVDKGVFHSESKAKEEFPTLFETSPAQEALHIHSEATAAESESKVLEQASTLDDQNSEKEEYQICNGDNAKSQNSAQYRPLRTTNYSALDARYLTTTIPGTQVPSLYPSYVPYRVQHLILSKIQCMLENSCFEFTLKWAPELIAQKGWDCPEAIELNKWTSTMYQQFDKLPDGALDNRYKSDITSVFASLCGLRHSAVHRLHVSVRGIDDMVHNAIIFTGMLRDTVRECQLNELHLELKRIARSQELHMNFLENRLKEEFDELRELREQLDKREQTALETMRRENSENQSLVAELLERSFGTIFSANVENGEQKPGLNKTSLSNAGLKIDNGNETVGPLAEEDVGKVASEGVKVIPAKPSAGPEAATPRDSAKPLKVEAREDPTSKPVEVSQDRNISPGKAPPAKLTPNVSETKPLASKPMQSSSGPRDSTAVNGASAKQEVNDPEPDDDSPKRMHISSRLDAAEEKPPEAKTKLQEVANDNNAAAPVQISQKLATQVDTANRESKMEAPVISRPLSKFARELLGEKTTPPDHTQSAESDVGEPSAQESTPESGKPLDENVTLGSPQSASEQTAQFEEPAESSKAAFKGEVQDQNRDASTKAEMAVPPMKTPGKKLELNAENTSTRSNVRRKDLDLDTPNRCYIL
ncbi:hypothetical protein PRK78_007152 [Emydomyces testavorans]|uniref:Uncharacterized protein n=1 Tax=Emydomyces testavorans TaxID=2070801 RepID=A0AAF0IL66_9EURO|nr:hypothetical protein PRK78_007152 [Emydomyces testavorans]